MIVGRSKEQGPYLRTGQSKAAIRQARFRPQCLVLTPYSSRTAPTSHWSWFKALNQQKLNGSQAEDVCDSSAKGHLTLALEHQHSRGGKHRRQSSPCQHQSPSSYTLSSSRFCRQLEKDTVKTQAMCLLLTLISVAPLSLISQC